MIFVVLLVKVSGCGWSVGVVVVGLLNLDVWLVLLICMILLRIVVVLVLVIGWWCLCKGVGCWLGCWGR